MIDYTGLACPDDPTRTADYGYFDNESLDERPTVILSEENAVRCVIDALRGREKTMFGWDGDDWEEMICCDYVCEKHRELAIALLKDDSQALQKIGAYLRARVGKRANKWLAEARDDEVEAEGFWP